MRIRVTISADGHRIDEPITERLPGQSHHRPVKELQIEYCVMSYEKSVTHYLPQHLEGDQLTHPIGELRLSNAGDLRYLGRELNVLLNDGAELADDFAVDNPDSGELDYPVLLVVQSRGFEIEDAYVV
jgi:hypothetical protein